VLLRVLGLFFPKGYATDIHIHMSYFQPTHGFDVSTYRFLHGVKTDEC